MFTRSVSAQVQVTTFAGSPAGLSGSDDGVGLDASFEAPQGLTFGPNGMLFVTEQGNHTIRRIAPDGTVTTVAGTAGLTGSDLGIGADARFNIPVGIVYRQADNVLYVADAGNSRIRDVFISTNGQSFTADTRTGQAGTGYTNGAVDVARFRNPIGLALSPNGNTLYISDWNNHVIRSLTLPATPTNGQVALHAGQAPIGINPAGGFANGPVNFARFNNPVGLAVDAQGNLYVADEGNHCIRRIAPSPIPGLPAQVTTYAVLGTVAGTANGNATTQARFNTPTGLAFDADGNLYVADQGNHAIRRIDRNTLQVTTVAGLTGTSGLAEGTGAVARFNQPSDLRFDACGNLYVSDRGNNRISKISFFPQIQLSVNGGTASGFVCGTGTVPVSFTATDPGNGYEVQWSVDGTNWGNAGLTSPTYQLEASLEGTEKVVYARVRNTATGCAGDAVFTFTTVVTPPAAPVFPSTTVCAASGSTVSFAGNLGGAARTLQVSETNTPTSVWNDVTDMDPITGNPVFSVILTVATATRYARVLELATGCTSSVVTLTANAAPAAPTFAAGGTSVSICGTGDVSFIASHPGAGYEVQWSTDNTTFGDAGTTSPAYAVAAVASITRYARVRNTTTGCVSSSVTLTGTANAQPAAPTFASTTVSRTGSGDISFTSGSLGTNEEVQWSENGTSGWAANGTSLSSPAYAVAAGATITRYARRFNTSTQCFSASVTLTGTATAAPGQLMGGTIGSSQTLCVGSDPAAFGSTTAASGGTGTLSYQWQSSTAENFSANVTSIAGATAATYDLAVQNTAGTTYYRRRVTDANQAEAFSNVINVVVNALPAAPVLAVQARIGAGNV
ncbi:MAG: hypothetical protein ACK5QE_03515, partial [Sphingobacteriia bacterium]